MQHLGRKTAHGAIYTVVGNLLSFALRTAGLVILARFLGPESFGLVAMVTVILTFMQVVSAFGLPQATIQRENIEDSLMSTIFWVNLGMAILMCFVTMVLAHPLAWFYDEERIVTVTIALSLMFPIRALGAQHSALLQREMRFLSQQMVGVIGQLVGLIAGVAYVFTINADYWALVIQNLTGAAVTSGGAWMVSRWVPARPAPNSDLISVIRYGANLTGGLIISRLTSSVDRLMIGRFFGATPLGFYSMGHSLVVQPTSLVLGPTANVMVSALSRLQNQPESYSRYYFTGLRMISVVMFPATFLAILLSKDLVPLVFGPKWFDAIPYFQVLLPLGLSRTLQSTEWWVYLSTGGTDRFMHASAMWSIIRVIGIGIGTIWGPLGVAVGYTVAEFLILPLSQWYCLRESPVNYLRALQTLVLPALAAGSSAMVAWTWSVSYGADWGTYLSMFSTAFLFTVINVLLVILSQSGRKKYLEDFLSIKRVFLLRDSSC